nr:hypothetical protein Iba_chr05fCG3330 [Ipomoea batatas]
MSSFPLCLIFSPPPRFRRTYLPMTRRPVEAELLVDAVRRRGEERTKSGGDPVAKLITALLPSSSIADLPARK